MARIAGAGALTLLRRSINARRGPVRRRRAERLRDAKLRLHCWASPLQRGAQILSTGPVGCVLFMCEQVDPARWRRPASLTPPGRLLHRQRAAATPTCCARNAKLGCMDWAGGKRAHTQVCTVWKWRRLNGVGTHAPMRLCVRLHSCCSSCGRAALRPATSAPQLHPRVCLPVCLARQWLARRPPCAHTICTRAGRRRVVKWTCSLPFVHYCNGQLTALARPARRISFAVIRHFLAPLPGPYTHTHTMGHNFSLDLAAKIGTSHRRTDARTDARTGTRRRTDTQARTRTAPGGAAHHCLGAALKQWAHIHTHTHTQAAANERANWRGERTNERASEQTNERTNGGTECAAAPMRPLAD